MLSGLNLAICILEGLSREKRKTLDEILRIRRYYQETLGDRMKEGEKEGYRQRETYMQRSLGKKELDTFGYSCSVEGKNIIQSEVQEVGRT